MVLVHLGSVVVCALHPSWQELGFGGVFSAKVQLNDLKCHWVAIGE